MNNVNTPELWDELLEDNLCGNDNVVSARINLIYSRLDGLKVDKATIINVGSGQGFLERRVGSTLPQHSWGLT